MERSIFLHHKKAERNLILGRFSKEIAINYTMPALRGLSLKFSNLCNNPACTCNFLSIPVILMPFDSRQLLLSEIFGGHIVRRTIFFKKRFHDVSCY